jgi:3-oxoadipate enol-lactonase
MMRSLLSAVVLSLLCAMSSAEPIATSGPGHYVEVDGAKLWYEECGATNAPAVILLHDGLLHSITWDGVWAPLCVKYHVVRYDRRGYGRSEPSKVRFVPEDDLYRVLRQVHIDRALIMGNSSGGALALDFALAHPEMVEALFLIGPVVHGMATSEYFIERGNSNSAPLDQGDPKAAAANWSNDRFLIAGDDPRSRKQLYDALTQNPQNLTVGGGLEIRPSPPAVTRLSQIRVPTMILAGDADVADVFAHCGAIEAAVPMASFEVWKDTGHLIQIQKPGDLVSRFNRFVVLATRQEVSLTEAQLTAYVGRYKLGNTSANVSLKENHLIVEIPGNPYYWLFAASNTRFFLRTEELEIEFQTGAASKELTMVVHNSDGSILRCPRVETGPLH